MLQASIGISTTGLKVLKRLDLELYDEILRTGHVITSWKLSSARGWTLAEIPAGGENEMMVMIGREALWGILKRRVPEEVIQRQKVVDVRLGDTESDRGPQLVLKRASTEPVACDLAVFADGIWSVGRKAMFGSSDQNNDSYEYAPIYE